MRIKIIIIFFLFCNLVLFSQNQLELDSLLKIKKVTSYLEYYQDTSKNETLETVQKKEFSFYGNKIFPGEQEEKFWFKLKLIESEKDLEDYFFLINTVSINKIVVYQDSNSGYNKLYEFQKNGKKDIEIPFNVIENSSFLFEVSFGKSIYFPITIENTQSLNNFNKSNLVIYGFYYGFALLVILINLFFYIQTKERFFLYYLLLAFSISLILFELDGLIYFLFGNATWILFIDVFLHTFLLVSFLLFTSEALQLNKHIPKLKWFGAVIILLNTISFLIYLLTNSLSWYSLGELFNLIGLLTYWFVSIRFLKKMVFARFLFIGFFVIITSNIVYVLPSEFGMKDIGFTPTAFKIGSVIEMLIFLYAISYRHKSLYVEKENIEQELESHKEQLIEKNKDTEINIQQKTDNFSREFNLTLREIEVLNYIVEGKGNKEIAIRLHLTEATIKYHCSKLYNKTNVKNRSQLAAIFASYNN
ncbi:7TM diverse intracellular signaling domain-containing protein [Polaribacter sp.]|uniref:7TM diverse intracellular signaling domain-containing protein n=1 Tax=Polaribacter sp. TaxID=1920175 RepID=UPI003EF0F3D8